MINYKLKKWTGCDASSKTINMKKYKTTQFTVAKPKEPISKNNRGSELNTVNISVVR
jgi:hypothetical protein